MLLVFYGFEPLDYGGGVFPLVELGFSHDLAVDSVRIFLLILPISVLVGLISPQVGLLAKFGLWSLRVMNASLLAVLSTLSIPSFVVMFLFSAWMACTVSGCAFL